MSDKKTNGGLLIGGEPRVDFLPQEIKQKKIDRKSRRSLISLVILVVAICIAGYAFAAFSAVQAQIQLDAARARTQTLLEQQGQYAEARSTATELDTARAAALAGSATEILWKEFIAELQKTLPKETYISTFSIDSQNALEPAPELSVPLENDRVTTVTFSVVTPSLTSAEALLKKLEELPGFADAAISSADLQADKPVYDVTIILHLNSDLFERRLFATDAEGNPKPVVETPVVEEEEEEEPGSTGTPTPTDTPSSGTED